MLTNDAWFGMNDLDVEGTWVWEDGSTVTYTNWDTSEPNDWGSGEDCGYIKTSGKWNDYPCDTSHNFICQFTTKGSCGPCATGYYPDSSNTCMPCSTTCAECSNAGVNDCTTCSAAKFFTSATVPGGSSVVTNGGVTYTIHAT